MVDKHALNFFHIAVNAKYDQVGTTAQLQHLKPMALIFHIRQYGSNQATLQIVNLKLDQ